MVGSDRYMQSILQVTGLTRRGRGLMYTQMGTVKERNTPQEI